MNKATGYLWYILNTAKPVLSHHSKIDKTNGSLMNIMLSWSILQYILPVLSDNWSLKQILVFFLNGSLRQVLL